MIAVIIYPDVQRKRHKIIGFYNPSMDSFWAVLIMRIKHFTG